MSVSVKLIAEQVEDELSHLRVVQLRVEGQFRLLTVGCLVASVLASGLISIERWVTSVSLLLLYALDVLLLLNWSRVEARYREAEERAIELLSNSLMKQATDTTKYVEPEEPEALDRKIATHWDRLIRDRNTISRIERASYATIVVAGLLVVILGFKWM